MPTLLSEHDRAALIEAVDAALPQTQCTKCGYAGCHPYAEAIVREDAPINQCPPGGPSGVVKLAALTGRAAAALNPVHGTHKRLEVAVIDEPRCIGCTLCIAACPVDAILGAPRQMHVVSAAACSGCELCLPACPVDCIRMVSTPLEWTPARARAARARYDGRARRQARIDELNAERRTQRLDAKADAHDAAHRPGHTEDERKRAIIARALARVRARRADQTGSS